MFLKNVAYFVALSAFDYLNKVWVEIIYPFPNFNDFIVEIWEWISNFISDFIMDVISNSSCVPFFGLALLAFGFGASTMTAAAGALLNTCTLLLLFVERPLGGARFLPVSIFDTATVGCENDYNAVSIYRHSSPGPPFTNMV